SSYIVSSFFFFFQAEDGIRDFHVTGVQTCALPISRERLAGVDRARDHELAVLDGEVRRVRRERDIEPRCETRRQLLALRTRRERSEERRVGKERRSRREAQQVEERRQ